MIEKKELQFVHLEEGLKAYNTGGTLKLIAIYLASAVEVFNASITPESFRPKLIEAASLTPEDAQVVQELFTERLADFAKAWKKPFGASEVAMADLMKTMTALEGMAPAPPPAAIPSLA